MPVAAALFTAVGAFLVGLLLEKYKRHSDKQVLAATILSEVTSLHRQFRELDIAITYVNFRDNLEKLKQAGQEYTGHNSNSLIFPVTVYEKCADKIGALGLQTAPEVVWFYNLLYGFRSTAQIATEESNMSLDDRIAKINYILSALQKSVPRVDLLRNALADIARTPWIALFPP